MASRLAQVYESAQAHVNKKCSNDKLKVHIIINYNKNDNIYLKAKQKNQMTRRTLKNYIVAANITEYHILSKLIFLRTIIPKFHVDKAILFHLKIHIFKLDVRTIWSQL